MNITTMPPVAYLLVRRDVDSEALLNIGERNLPDIISAKPSISKELPMALTMESDITITTAGASMRYFRILMDTSLHPFVTTMEKVTSQRKGLPPKPSSVWLMSTTRKSSPRRLFSGVMRGRLSLQSRYGMLWLIVTFVCAKLIKIRPKEKSHHQFWNFQRISWNISPKTQAS